ncbi:hypothetical protein [Microbacterium sp. LMI1-1-1.1]|uniref:hypothetical protein n=1 Tax=Microbacterium sp. LMI1-1-1.1 TaxID=3135223 RepID=UPI0034673B85
MTRRTIDPPPFPLSSEDADDTTQGFAPTCPGCLLTLEPHVVGDRAVWRCPGCGLLVVA